MTTNTGIPLMSAITDQSIGIPDSTNAATSIIMEPTSKSSMEIHRRKHDSLPRMYQTFEGPFFRPSFPSIILTPFTGHFYHFESQDPFWDKNPVLKWLFLVDSWREFGPWYVIVKVVLAAMVSMLMNRITQCGDDVSTSFTSSLVVSAVVSQGLRNSWDVLWSGLLGSLLGLTSVAVWGLANTPINSGAFATDMVPWLRVPLTMGAACYILFLLKQFSNPGAITSAVFSALFVQLAQIPYSPIAGSPTWVQVLVTRILALTTGCLCASIINFIVSGLFYSNIFRNQQYVAESQLVFALPKLLEGDFAGEFIFGSILGKLNSGQDAIKEMRLMSCECCGTGRKSMLRAFNRGETPDIYRARAKLMKDANWSKKQLRRVVGPFRAQYTQLLNFTYAMKLYLQLSSIYAFTGKSHRNVKIPSTIVNGKKIVWIDLLDQVLLKSLSQLGKRLGWPPMQGNAKQWRGKSLTDRIFRKSAGKRGLLMKPPVPEPLPEDVEVVWTGPSTSLVRDVVINVLSETIGSGSDATPESLFQLVRPTVQNIVMSLDAVVAELLYMMGEGDDTTMALDVTSDSDSDSDVEM